MERKPGMAKPGKMGTLGTILRKPLDTKPGILKPGHLEYAHSNEKVGLENGVAKPGKMGTLGIIEETIQHLENRES